MLSLRDSVRRLLPNSTRPSRLATAKLSVEALETRQLLSTFSLNNAGVLTEGTTQVDVNVSSFRTDSAGDLFELKTNGVLWELPVNGAWTQLDLNVGTFNVNASGKLEEVKTSGGLWFNATPGNTSTWTKIAGNVSHAGIDDLGNVYYLSSNSSFNVWDSTTGSTQINETGYGVVSFAMGGSGNEQVYYAVTVSTGSGSTDYNETVYDWTDHTAAGTPGQYGINVTAALQNHLDGYQVPNPSNFYVDYAVGSNGDLYLAGSKTGALHSATRSIVLAYAPAAGKTGTVSALFTATDSTTHQTFKITDLQETADGKYLFVTGYNFQLANVKTGTFTSSYTYFDRYLISSAPGTDPTQLYKIDFGSGKLTNYVTSTVTSAEAVTLGNLEIGSDDVAYVATFASSPTAYVTDGHASNVTLLGATVTATTASVIDANLSVTANSLPFTVAPNGNLMVIETGGKVVNYNVQTGSQGFVEDPAGASQIDFGPNGELFEVKTNGKLWELAAGTWVQLDGAGTQYVTTMANGALYDLKDNGNFWLFTGTTSSATAEWTLLSSGVGSFATAYDGQVVYNKSGSLYVLYPNLYNPNGQFLVQESVGGNDYFINNGDELFFTATNSERQGPVQL